MQTNYAEVRHHLLRAQVHLGSGDDVSETIDAVLSLLIEAANMAEKAQVAETSNILDIGPFLVSN